MSNCGACDLGHTHFCEKTQQIAWIPPLAEWVDRKVDSEHHSHPIVPWAVEEKCVQCGYPASHKVTEDGGNPRLHPMTAYVCCNHFWSICKNTMRTDKATGQANGYANGHTYDRT